VDQGATRPPKKLYHTPELREYGDLRRITESTPGQKGMPDGDFIGKLGLKSVG